MIDCTCLCIKRETDWVEASVFPSGLNAAAIVDLGGGNSGQYLAEKCLNDSASTLIKLDETKSESKNEDLQLY